MVADSLPLAPSRNRSNNGGGSLVELRVRGPRIPHWIAELQTTFGAEVRLLACRPIGRRHPRLLRLLQITAPGRLEEVTRELERRRGREEVTFAPMPPDQLVVRHVSPMPALCSSVFDLGAVCGSCPMLGSGDPDDDRSAVWDVVVPRAPDAWYLLRSFARPGEPLPRLLRSGRFRGGRRLTPRQDQALRTAFRMGYFEYPRRASLGEVARALEVSRATALEILRRATGRVLVERYAGGGRLRGPDPLREVP